MKEIGSDFWTVERKNVEYFLSGRTALDFIIRDIIAEHEISSVLLPSFCCHTMIEPFVRHKLDIRFYDVVMHKERLTAILPDPFDKEIILYMDYFGYGIISGLEKVDLWDIKIEDCTHTAFNSKKSNADYSFASYRKWTGFTAIAEARKYKGGFAIESPQSENSAFERKRVYAMKAKEQWLYNDLGDKEEYLNGFKQAEAILDLDYVGYGPSYKSLVNLLSIDIEKIKEQRIKNAKVLYEILDGIEGIKFVFPEPINTVPLNVPVLVEDGLRDDLRKHLINNDVYCPVHWPLSQYHLISDKAKSIYRSELSLICDQRYDESDMERQAKLICIRIDHK